MRLCRNQTLSDRAYVPLEMIKAETWSSELFADITHSNRPMCCGGVAKVPHRKIGRGGPRSSASGNTDTLSRQEWC